MLLAGSKKLRASDRSGRPVRDVKKVDTLYQQLMESAVSFLKAADLQVVLVVTLLTFMVRRTFWAAMDWPPGFVVWIPFLFSFLLTPVIGTTEEIQWGGKYYARACTQNGAVAMVVWLLVVPILVKKWPRLLKDDPTAATETNRKIPPLEPP